MGTMISYNGDWTAKLGENVVIQQLSSNNNCIGA
jgi:hypothetical protein